MDLAAGLPWPVPIWRTIRDDPDSPHYRPDQKIKRKRAPSERDLTVSDEPCVAA